jgi:predicted transcriptional regulator
VSDADDMPPRSTYRRSWRHLGEVAEQLSEPQRAVLAVVAAEIGREWSLPELAAATDRTHRHVGRIMTALLLRGLAEAVDAGRWRATADGCGVVDILAARERRT